MKPDRRIPLFIHVYTHNLGTNAVLVGRVSLDDLATSELSNLCTILALPDVALIAL